MCYTLKKSFLRLRSRSHTH